MDNSANMFQLCRLCLVKDEVNIPIFEEQGDIRQIFQKISSCLPVKVSQDDKLPKKICDGCSYKLDMCYEFWNTSANAEKQLLSWLNDLDVNEKLNDLHTPAGTQPAKPTDTDTIVKQEKQEEIDPSDVQKEEEDDEEKGYMFQQNLEENNAGPSAAAAAVSDTNEDEPPPKRQRRTAAVKAAIALDNDSDDDDDSGEPITKMEDESEDSDGDDNEPSYADVPSTSADDQPGPSGVGKDGADAPFFPEFEVEMKIEDNELDIKETYKKERQTSVEKSSPTKKKIKEEISDDEEYTPPGYKKKNKPREKKEAKSKEKKIKRQEHKIWTCRRCLEEFVSRRDLTDHTKLYHVEEAKDQHTYKFDEEQDIYTCNTCSAEYQTKEEVKEHISKIHEEFYTCEVCKHTSTKAYSFAVHMKMHSSDDTYTCPLCSYNTPRRTCLQTHINRVHYHKFYYTCPTCGKGFNDSVIYKEHNNEHLGIKPFVCVVCNKDFVYSRYMLIHQTRYHTVHIEGTLHKTQCSICLKVFSKVATLLKHITTKHNTAGDDKPEKRHLCDMCGKGFGTSDKLKIHYRIHTGDKPFACRYCDKRFTKKDYLVMHERVHTGEKPYPCEYCGKCFNQAASLRIHVRGHTGERPYICQFCNGGYISRGSLNLHMKICNGIVNV